MPVGIPIRFTNKVVKNYKQYKQYNVMIILTKQKISTTYFQNHRVN